MKHEQIGPRREQFSRGERLRQYGEMVIGKLRSGQAPDSKPHLAQSLNWEEDSRTNHISPRECLKIYKRDIYSGFSYQFDHGLNDFQDFITYTMPDHLHNLVGLRENVVALRQYAQAMRGFVGQPYSIPGRNGAPYALDIATELVDVYDLFASGMAYYANVAEDVVIGRSTEEELGDAAQAVCRILRPDDWDLNADRGQPIHIRPSLLSDPMSAMYLSHLIDNELDTNVKT